MAQLPQALADAGNELSAVARAALADLLGQIRELDARLKALMQQSTALASGDPAYLASCSASRASARPSHRPYSQAWVTHSNSTAHAAARHG